MAETDSTEVVDDVGPSRSETLADIGIGNVGELANADPDVLSEDAGLDPGTAEKIVENAQLVLGYQSDNGDSDEDVEAGWDVVEDEVSPDVGPWTSRDPFDYLGDESDVDGYPVALEMDDLILNHVIHVVLEEATRAHQMSNVSRRDTAYGLATKLMAVELRSDGDIDNTVTLSEEELGSFYQALTRGSEEYARRSGISKMYGTLDDLRNVVNSQRQNAMRE